MIYVLLANGFEETEAITPIDLLRRGGLDVVTVGVNGKTIFGAHRIPVVCDLIIEDAEIEKAEAVILPGGMPGTLNLEASAKVQEIVRHCEKNGSVIGAICAAPSILGHMGILKGKKATCYPGFEKELTGAEISCEPAVRDGNIITSRGAGTACQFAYALIEALCSAEEAKAVKESIQWQK